MPHISEEIWSNLGNKTLCINEYWVDEKVKEKINIKIAVQINGKTKEIMEINDTISKDELLELAKNNDKIKKNIMDKKIKREIYVPGKIINLVI